MKKIILILLMPVILCGFSVIPDISPAETDNYNVVIITIDTLRADHLGCYGYFRDTSPFIDTLAKKGFTFKNAITSVPLTAPSHASMFTGQYPAEHGVLSNGYTFTDSNDTLAELLKRNGYNTAAFIGLQDILGKKFGFSQGFNFFSSGNKPMRRAREVNRSAFNWLEENTDKGKFFIWIHYYDVHCEYYAPKPYFNMFYPDYKGTLDPRGKCGLTAYNKMKLSDDDILYIKALYDGEIRYVDKQIENLFKKMNVMGLSKKTIFIITSDHGESLAERVVIGHNHCLYDYEIKVPLIILHPDMKASEVMIEKQAELTSLKSTVLDMLDIGNSTVIGGPSLFPLLKKDKVDEAFGYSRTAFKEGRDQIYSIRNSQWKLILNKDKNYRREMYALDKDPDEVHDLIDKKPLIEKTMLKKIKQWIEQEEKEADGKKQKLDNDVIQKLKSLGYVGQ